MAALLLVLMAVVCLGAHAAPPALRADPVLAVSGLIERVLPQYSNMFSLSIISQQGGKDVMQLASSANQIVLRGSSGIALASAFNWYLNDFCNTTYDWNTYAAVLPDGPLPLPPAQGTPIRARMSAWNYYMNVCTYGYSLAFSDWDYWVKHIDWMAMNGINLPLAFVGQEAIIVRVFTESFNLTFAEMQAFISGPAFLPWYRMGNIQGWGGPIPLSWITNRYQLQVKILARMRELGMTPVLSAFAGHVPEAFVKAYPSANVSRSSDWCGFPEPYGSVYLLEATDSHFLDIGSRYIAVQEEMYGTDHIYNCDTYNEMDPRSRDTTYLTASSRAVYAAMTATDPDAIWLMQGWLFRNSGGFWQPAQIQAYLGGVPDKSMWILDLSANDYPIWSRTNSFYGKPFIWCNLLNFGGQQGLNGNLPAIHDGIASASKNSTMIGVGITMEGIWQNYPAFEYTLRFAWFNNTPQDYIAAYAARRYGPGATADVLNAWNMIYALAYQGDGSFGSATTAYPQMAAEMPGWLARMEARGQTTPAMIRSYYTSHFPPAALGGSDRDSCPFAQVNDAYLAGLAPGYDPSHSPFDNHNLAAAEAWCQKADFVCGGITLSDGLYDARVSWTPQQSPTGETSWVKQCSGPWSRVWHDLLAASSVLGDVPSYRFDLVDVTRQVLSFNFSRTFADYKALYALGYTKQAEITAIAQTLMSILADYDAILSSDSNFMLGPWLSSARAWGTTTEEMDLFEFNARNQLTLWGPTGQINDYAAKSWGGLVRDYYAQRWQLFLTDSLADLAAHRPFSQAAFDRNCYVLEQAFQTNHTVYPVVPEYGAVELSTALYNKYVGPL